MKSLFVDPADLVTAWKKAVASNPDTPAATTVRTPVHGLAHFCGRKRLTRYFLSTTVYVGKAVYVALPFFFCDQLRVHLQPPAPVPARHQTPVANRSRWSTCRT